eukprot:7378944-Prymnesium_polylepis.2
MAVGERGEGVVLRVEQPLAVLGNLDHHLLGEVHQRARVIERPVELARLARQPARGLRVDVLPEGVHAQCRRHLVAAEGAQEKLLEDVRRAWHHEALQEADRLHAVPEDRHRAVEGLVHAATLCARVRQVRVRALLRLAPRLCLWPLALGVRLARVHAVEGRELGERVRHLVLERLGLLQLHGVDDRVAPVLLALTVVGLALKVALRLRHLRPRVLADLLLRLSLCCLDQEALRLLLGAAIVAHDHGVLGEPVQPQRLGLGTALLRPAAHVVHLLVDVLPACDQLRPVHEDLGFDRLGGGHRAPARRQRAAAHDDVDAGARRVVGLELRVRRVQVLAELGRCIAAEGDDAPRLGDAQGRHALAGDASLVAPLPLLTLDRLRVLHLRCVDAEHVAH